MLTNKNACARIIGITSTKGGIYMYEERKDTFALRDIILQVLFVALFVFILMWLFPTKNYVTNYTNNAITEAVEEALQDFEYGGGVNSEAFANQLFNQNVLMMKDSAKSYFTLSRLPQKTGESKEITLAEMLEEKIILPFVDSKGKKCDASKSYVKVTKSDDEYLMKVNLSCSDYEDYLLIHMGCYDYCSIETVQQMHEKGLTCYANGDIVTYE